MLKKHKVYSFTIFSEKKKILLQRLENQFNPFKEFDLQTITILMTCAPVSVMVNRVTWSHALSCVWSQSSTKLAFLFSTAVSEIPLWDWEFSLVA